MKTAENHHFISHAGVRESQARVISRLLSLPVQHGFWEGSVW